MQAPLKDRTIVIVGGTSGIGLSAAKACAVAGAQLLIVGREEHKLADALVALGGDVEGMSGDASDPKTAQQAVRSAVRRFGRLDGLYHVAGGSGRSAGDGPLHEISPEGWQATLRMNLDALFHSNQAAVQQYLHQGGGGAILNMSSVLGFAPSAEFFATHAYAATKAAAIGLTKACAAYYAPHNIRLNVIAPALVDTPMAQRAVADEATLCYIRTRQCLEGGRTGLPEDLDQAAVFFLSDASRYITGQVLAVDGGWSVRG